MKKKLLLGLLLLVLIILPASACVAEPPAETATITYKGWVDWVEYETQKFGAITATRIHLCTSRTQRTYKTLTFRGHIAVGIGYYYYITVNKELFLGNYHILRSIRMR